MNCLIETRNRHFMEACHRLILSLDPKEPVNVAEVAAKAAEMPAPHYYFLTMRCECLGCCVTDG
ncbi:MAG: hypothetical protein K2J65_05855 [Duncaniella sp.]|nr:hypothetical protein [Duncaniella sp.]